MIVFGQAVTALLLSVAAAAEPELGKPESVIALEADTGHVQGIDTDGKRLWVTWVDVKNKTGHLGIFELSSGKMLRSVSLGRGAQYHPGGIAADGDSIWVPVAEYRANSSTTVQRRNKDTLELEREFAVADHIGCIAADAERLFGGNWDSRQIYVWTRDGDLLERRDNPTGTRFQDLKRVGGVLVGAGLRESGGSIDWIDEAWRLRRRVVVGRTDRGVVFTHEGMAISEGRLYLLPEDAPSRLFVFRVPD